MNGNDRFSRTAIGGASRRPLLGPKGDYTGEEKLDGETSPEPIVKTSADSPIRRPDYLPDVAFYPSPKESKKVGSSLLTIYTRVNLKFKLA